MVKITVYTSLVLSLLVQAITGIIEILTLFLKVPTEFSFLKQLMLMEVIVQSVEFLFYIYWSYNFTKITNITPKRYFDWAFTTPTMLITLIFYLIFLKNGNQHFFELFSKEFKTIFIILILNWTMLLFGYLGEINVIPVLMGVTLGFIPFLIYYYIIYKKYTTPRGLYIFLYFFIFWSFYGVAALLPYKVKNILYNILDLFSKNFFGIFLGYIIIKKSWSFPHLPNDYRIF
jgi:bacteriorhodopsin